MRCPVFLNVLSGNPSMCSSMYTYSPTGLQYSACIFLYTDGCWNVATMAEELMSGHILSTVSHPLKP